MEEKPLTRGLVFGKFMPPHRGHEFLIRTARAQVDELTVAVCSLSSEPIPGALRLAWMQELYPDLRVVHVTDENPSEPADHPDFWRIWTETLQRVCPSPDVLFTSEDYGPEMARHLGARHVSVDVERLRVPISASQIREHPYRHWAFLPECVRPYFVRRVVITGPESTGKTTLAQDLARHYDTVWVPEFARGYLDVKNAGAPPDAPICVPEDLPPIVAGQTEAEDRLARKANRILFLDTDPLVTAIYSQHYFGNCPPWLRAAADSRRYDLHLLLDIDVPWVPDPQRDRPHMRQHMYDLFRQGLEQSGRPFVPISGSWQERLQKARAAIDPRLV